MDSDLKMAVVVILEKEVEAEVAAGVVDVVEVILGVGVEMTIATKMVVAGTANKKIMRKKNRKNLEKFIFPWNV